METVTLKVQIGSFSVEVTGTPEYAEAKLHDLITKYLSGVIPQNSVAAINDPKMVSSGKVMAPSEFIKKASPRSQNERALLLGYYLEKYNGAENFSTGDLAEICKTAKQPNFSNVSDSVGKLVSQGLLMGAGERDSKRVYVLTTTGEDEVQNLLKSKSE